MPQRKKITKFKSSPVRGPQVIIYEGENDTYSCKFELTEDEMKAVLTLVELELRSITTWKDPDLVPTSALRKLQTRLRSVLHIIKLSRKNNNA